MRKPSLTVRVDVFNPKLCGDKKWTLTNGWMVSIGLLNMIL